ncbi:MAG: hypothetical protein DMG38_12470 [Acidobacteria bacterium]|nr:MAG: hypothetical protein DMG38_12470 [Acidobacteriota bacterium]
MWLLAAAIFAGCKWQTWGEARATGRVAGNSKRSAAYLLVWPGMNAREFFDATVKNQRICRNDWLAATAKTSWPPDAGRLGRLWSDCISHRVHLRVLKHIRAEAEAASR